MWECSHVQQLNQGRKGTRRFSPYRFQACPSWISTAARSSSGVSPREYKIHACELCALGCTKYATVQNVQLTGQNPAVKCPLGRTKPAAPGSRSEERRGSGVQSLATMSGVTTNYTRANVRFCKCRYILLHLRALIAPDQDGKVAFSGAAVSCSLQIRLDSPRGFIQVPAYSLNLCPVRSAGVPGGRRMGGTCCAALFASFLLPLGFHHFSSCAR